MEDFSEEVKRLIKEHKQNGFEYGKPIDFLMARNKITKEEIENELINCDEIAFAKKQERDDETRYLLYFVYSKRKGRAYVIKFKDKIRIITIYPLGRKTLKRYKLVRFKR